MAEFSTLPSDRRREAGVAGNSPPPWLVVLVVLILAASLVIVVLLIARGDTGEIQAVAPTSTTTSTTSGDVSTTTTTTAITTTTAAVSTTSASVASTSGASTTLAATSTSASTPTSASVSTSAPTSTEPPVDPERYASAVWPRPESSLRFDEPSAAAAGFAADVLGFQDPVVGPFLQGDAGSGEVDVRPSDDGPVTTVFVRQLDEEDTWWVLGAATADIMIDSPTAMDEVTSPLVVIGRAQAFEGVVDVVLMADGTDTPIATGFVVGGGTSLEPFEGRFEFEGNDRTGGTLVLMTTSMDDGRTWAAAVVRVVLVGG